MLLSLVARPSYAIPPTSALTHPACTATIQQVQAAPASFSDHAPPATGWQTVQLPDTWRTRGQSQKQTWYRIDWQYHCPTEKRTAIAVAISAINMAGSVHFDDQLLWKNDSLQEPLSRSWNTPHYWILPVQALQGTEHQLWVQVIGEPLLNAGLGEVQIGDPALVKTQYQDWLWWQRHIIAIRFFCSISFGIICFFIWFFYREESAFGWFALTCLFWVSFLFLVLKTETLPFANSLMIAKCMALLQFLYILCFCIYTWRFAQQSYPKVEYILYVLLSIFTLALIFLPEQSLTWFLPMMSTFTATLFFLNCLFYTYIAWNKKQFEVYLLAACLLVFLITGLYSFSPIQQKFNLFISPFVAPVIGLFITISLSLRLAKNIRRIKSFHHTLKQNIKQTKEELSSSLHQQYQLEIQNTKLQERIHLAHDLHDSLGGALVRSITLIQQSQNHLSNQQFLSILKLLRDDLRQVIDSGSSNGAKIPESPILWGAPIRHRFDQLFEELEIESTWHLPEQWQFELSALECLTLLRVAEEALTNIIKHSQASHVKVSLSQTGQQQLILEIEDDGMGFDVEAIQQAGMSIGLRSMKFRLEKIQAHMNIVSQPGKTVVQVIKKFSPAPT